MTAPVLVCGRGAPTPDSPLLGLFELDQARALHVAGVPVVYAGLDVRSLRRHRRWGLVRGEHHGVPTLVLNVPLGRLPRRLNRWLMTRLWNVLLAVVRREHGRPRVLHGHFLPWAAALASTRAARHVPLVVTEHWSRLRYGVDGPVRALGERTYPRAAAVLAVSTPLAEVIERGFGVQAEVVGNIVDLATFAPLASTPREPEIRLVATAVLTPRKNVDGLLRAFASSAPADASLVVIGEGSERSGLERLADDLGLSGRVRFTGRLTRAEMAAEYARATGFALASHAETFGVVWAEALAAGLPVLATRCGGPEDFVGPDNGVLVDDAPEAVAAGLSELCAGIESGRWDGQALSRDVAERSSEQAVVDRLLAVYSRVT